MKTELRKFKVSVPTLDGAHVAEWVDIEIPMEWDEDVGEWLMTEEGLQQVEETKARYMGLLLPHELRALRERLDMTQAQIGELLQIGQKTWTRWETGKGRPSRSVNLLLKALHDRELSTEYLRRATRHGSAWSNIIPFTTKKASVSMDKLWGNLAQNEDQLQNMKAEEIAS
jgi:DNA-binding transcriptional regulator YiaG